MNQTTTAISEHATSLGHVDSCLSELYTQAMEQEGAVPTVRTVLLNLIAYSSDPALAERAAEYAIEIVSSVSCRAIVADVASADQQQGASVSVVCGVSERGDRRLCGEVIRVYAVPGSVTGAVMPLLIPDVPVYLWVLGDVPQDREDFGDLLRVASHVILDTRATEPLGQSLRAVDRLRRADGGDRIVQDLAWMSLHAWREATAQHFDPHAVRQYLAHVTEVNIQYSGSNAAPLPESAPLLFASWFADRVGLRSRAAFHSRDDGFRIDATQEDHPALVRVIPTDSDREPGHLLSVEVRCGAGDNTACLTTEGVTDTQMILTEDCKDVCLPPKTTDVPPLGTAALATTAIRSYRRDRVYESAVDTALKIIGQIELSDERSTQVRL